eukprot:Opistho-2@76906
MSVELGETSLQRLYTWIDEIPLSRPKRNITRDFSDGVMVAETVKHFIPRLVELHNYVPSLSSSQKMSNWNTLNQKVFRKLNFTVPDDVVQAVIGGKPGVVEVVLNNLRVKIDKHLARRQQDDFSYDGYDDAPRHPPAQYAGSSFGSDSMHGGSGSDGQMYGGPPPPQQHQQPQYGAPQGVGGYGGHDGRMSHSPAYAAVGDGYGSGGFAAGANGQYNAGGRPGSYRSPGAGAGVSNGNGG